jgi:hypothetical protein
MSEGLPKVAVQSFSRSSPNDRRYSTGGRGSRSISRRAWIDPNRRALRKMIAPSTTQMSPAVSRSVATLCAVVDAGPNTPAMVVPGGSV